MPSTATTAVGQSIKNSFDDSQNKSTSESDVKVEKQIVRFHKPHTLRRPRLMPTFTEAPGVLHIDDDVELLNAMWTRLRDSGFAPHSASNGMDGLKQISTAKTDAIILDYDMPEMRGDAVIESLKSNDDTKHIPIVVLTAIRGHELKYKMLDLGADVVMNKPFEFDFLKSEIERLISDSNPQDVACI